MEMQWLREHGAIATYDDYVSLPVCVLEDARLLMEAEGQRMAKERAKADRTARSGIRG